ncbi:MAG: DUF2510 domain-containing protein [Microbacteriaceae bacterium]
MTVAGWYPNPDNSLRQRYWDGVAWTAQEGTSMAFARPGASAEFDAADRVAEADARERGARGRGVGGGPDRD